MEQIASLKEKWFKKEIERLTNLGVSKADIARTLDIKPQYLNSVLNGSRGLADSFLDKFIEAYNINQLDLLPRTDEHSSSIMSMHLMKKIDEKDAKIDQLQDELRQQSVELAALKALRSKEMEHQSGFGGIVEPFAAEPLTSYGNDFSSTSPPPASKKSSAGKMHK